VSKTRRAALLLAFAAPALIAGTCSSDNKETGDTGDTYQGAKADGPDLGWRIGIEQVDWDAEMEDIDGLD
jgi:hypothetical protein